MILHQLIEPPTPELAHALNLFERDFTYPLGPSRSFRIEHGNDYARFFRAIGSATCFVATRPDGVVATIAVAIRKLLVPDGSERPVAYLADLKIAPRARDGIVLLRLIRAVQTWSQAHAEAAMCVVMDGTRVTPDSYTGRLGIPAFCEVGKVAVLRIPTCAKHDAEQSFETAAGFAEECYRRLSVGRYATPSGLSTERSETVPAWLMQPSGDSCGLLEDTRKAKRLVADDGSELRSIHLSQFAYRTVPAGVELLHVALDRSARLGFPALFVSVSLSDADLFCEILGITDVAVAPATIYGVGLTAGCWNVNTSEI